MICDITSISTLEQCGWEHGKSRASVRYAYTRSKKRNQRRNPNAIIETQSETSNVGITERNSSKVDENITAETDGGALMNRRMPGSSTGTSTVTGLEQHQKGKNMSNAEFECRGQTAVADNFQDLRNGNRAHRPCRFDITVQINEKQSWVEDSEDVEITSVASGEARSDMAVGSDGRNMDAGGMVSVDVCSPSDPCMWMPQDGPSGVSQLPSKDSVTSEESKKQSRESKAVIIQKAEVYSYTSVDTLVRNNWAYQTREHDRGYKNVYITSNSNGRDKLFGFD